MITFADMSTIDWEGVEETILANDGYRLTVWKKPDGGRQIDIVLSGRRTGLQSLTSLELSPLQLQDLTTYSVVEMVRSHINETVHSVARGSGSHHRAYLGAALEGCPDEIMDELASELAHMCIGDEPWDVRKRIDRFMNDVLMYADGWRSWESIQPLLDSGKSFRSEHWPLETHCIRKVSDDWYEDEKGVRFQINANDQIAGGKWILVETGEAKYPKYTLRMSQRLKDVLMSAGPEKVRQHLESIQP